MTAYRFQALRCWECSVSFLIFSLRSNILTASLVNTYLMGVIMSQFWTYWLSDYNDPWWTRAMVAFLFILNATQAGSLVYMLWFYCVANFANPAIITEALWPYSFTAMVTAILAIINQSFQSWRIYAFTKNKILTGCLFVTLVATFGMGLAAAIQSWMFSDVVKVAAIQPIVEANLSFQMALDVLIAGILTWIFSKSKTSFKRTDKVLNRLIRTAVQSGSFTGDSAVFALGTLFTFRFAPGTYMLAIFALPIGRIYTHTMMDHLITRQELRAILSNNGELVSVPNFNNSGREAGRDGTAIMLRTTASHASSPSHLKGVDIADSLE
ncbi:hypothetical protein DFH06DRAFT_1079989 [Mycena polygramma]|nr:hypothetical protein DFH06DRAFT_1079989 [Mycena polygramma]